MESVIVASAMIEPRSPFEMESSADSSQGSTVLQINFNHNTNADGPPKSRLTEESSDEDRKVTELSNTHKYNSSGNFNLASNESKFLLDNKSKESLVSSQQQQQRSSIPGDSNSVDGAKGPDSDSLKPHRTVPASRPAVTIPIANGLVEKKLPIHNVRVLSSLESPNEWIGCEFSSVLVTATDSLSTVTNNVVENTRISLNTSTIDCSTKDKKTEQLLATENSDSDRNLFITMTRMKDTSSVAVPLVFKKSSCSNDALRGAAVSEISLASGATISPETVANIVVSSSNADECIAPFRGHVHHIPESEDGLIAMQSAALKAGAAPRARSRSSSSRSDSAYSLRSTTSVKESTKVRSQTKRQLAAGKAEKKVLTEVKSKSKLQTDLKPSMQSDMKNQEKVMLTTDVVEPMKAAVTSVKCEAILHASGTLQADVNEHKTQSPNDDKIVEISEIKDKSEANESSINVKVETSVVAEMSSAGPGCPLGVSFIPAFTAKKVTKCGKIKTSKGIKANKTSAAATISATSASVACTTSVSTSIVSDTTASVTVAPVTMTSVIMAPPVTIASVTMASVTTAIVTTTAFAATTSPSTTFATTASVMTAFASSTAATNAAGGVLAKPRRPAKVRMHRDKTDSVRLSTEAAPTDVTTPESEIFGKVTTGASQAPVVAPSLMKIDGLSSPPKKPLTPYMKFSKSIWAKSRSLHQTTRNVCEVGSNIGRMWRELPDAEKQLFIDEFTVEKLRYDNDVQAYLKRTGLQISDLPKTNKSRRKLAEQKERTPGSGRSKPSRVSATLTTPPGSASTTPLDFIPAIAPGSAPTMPGSVPIMSPGSAQTEPTVSPVNPPTFPYSGDSPSLTNDQVAEQMARSFLESAGINGDSIQQQQQQQYESVGLNNGCTTVTGDGYQAVCVDANGFQTLNSTEGGYQINGNSYQAVAMNSEGYQTAVPNGNVGGYQTSLEAGDGYQTGLDNNDGYQTGLGGNSDGYQTSAVTGECYQTGAIKAEVYQAAGEGVNIDGSYQNIVANGNGGYQTIGSANDQTNGQFYQWARQQMYDQNGQQIYSNTADQNDAEHVSLEQSQQAMGINNGAMASLYSDPNRGQAMIPTNSAAAPSTVDSSWLWNQLNTAVADQFIPTGNPSSQQDDIQYNNATVSGGNVDGVGVGGNGMLIYQLSADGTIDASSGLISSSDGGLLEVGEVPGDEQLNAAQQNQQTDLSSRDTNGSMLYQLSLYGDNETGDSYRQWAAGCQMGAGQNNGETSNPVVVDVEKQQLRSALIEKGKECERLVVELHQAYLLIHQLKQQNDIYQRHWTTTAQAVEAGDGCGGDGNSNMEMTTNVSRVGDNIGGGDDAPEGGGS